MIFTSFLINYMMKILNYLFSRISEPYGFFILVATIAIFQNIVVYRLVKKYVYKKYWALSVFIYLFTTNLYLLSFSMMRQSFVVWIFLALWPHIKRRNWLFSLLVLFLCSFIHSSALILIPFAFMGFWQVKNGKAIAVVWLILFIALSFSSSLISKFVAIGANVDVFNAFIATYQESGIQVGSGIGLSSVPFFISLYFLFSQKSNNTAINQLVIISTFSFIFGTISHVIPLASRLSIYFDAYNILSFPLIFNALKRPFRPFFIILFCFSFVFKKILHKDISNDRINDSGKLGSGRGKIWKKTWHLIKEKPLLGYGPDNLLIASQEKLNVNDNLSSVNNSLVSALGFSSLFS